MKIKRLVIKNIGMIADTVIELNKPLIIFYGEIKQGKTTILNAVRWCFGGSYPVEIIRHGQQRASVLLELEGGSISREWYVAKDGTTKDNPISFIRDGKPIKGRVVDEIKKFLNPFLLDQDHLRKMGETERKQYFAQLFAVDTGEIDSEILKTENQGRELRAQVKGYGEIDLTEVKQIDVAPLKKALDNIKRNNNEDFEKVTSKNRLVFQHNNEVNLHEEYLDDIGSKIKELETQLADAKERITKNQIWLKENPRQSEIPMPQAMDTTVIEARISEAAANEVRYEQYQKNLQRAEERLANEKRLSELEAKYRGLKKDKTAKLAKIGETCGIKNLAFDETGNFIYEETTAGMLSGSQIMKLSEELSNLYPKDLGIGLIDRAESLGKSVFLLIDRAKEEEKTILATVVGERPAEIPAEVGVWIVEKGELK